MYNIFQKSNETPDTKKRGKEMVFGLKNLHFYYLINLLHYVSFIFGHSNKKRIVWKHGLLKFAYYPEIYGATQNTGDHF